MKTTRNLLTSVLIITPFLAAIAAPPGNMAMQHGQMMQGGQMPMNPGQMQNMNGGNMPMKPGQMMQGGQMPMSPEQMQNMKGGQMPMNHGQMMQGGQMPMNRNNPPN